MMATDNAPQEDNHKNERDFDENEISFALQQLARYGDAIGKEFTLVSDRMTWLVVSNSFMFASFNSAAVNFVNAGVMKPLAATMILMMPLLGLAMAWFVIPALDAAHVAAELLKNKRSAFENRLPMHLRIETISSKDDVHAAGNKPPYWIPRILVFVWLVLFVVAGWRLFFAESVPMSDRPGTGAPPHHQTITPTPSSPPPPSQNHPR